MKSWKTASAGNGGAGTHATRRSFPSTSRWGWAPGISTGCSSTPCGWASSRYSTPPGRSSRASGCSIPSKISLRPLRPSAWALQRSLCYSSASSPRRATPGSPATSSSGTSVALISCPTAPTAPAALWIKRSGPGFWRPARWTNSPAPSWASTKTIRRTTTSTPSM